MPNLNMCKDAIAMLMTNQQDVKKNDKVSRAQEMVNQATKAMQENVKNIINNQSEFSVSRYPIANIYYRDLRKNLILSGTLHTLSRTMLELWKWKLERETVGYGL
jgi:hypothetical protein